MHWREQENELNCKKIRHCREQKQPDCTCNKMYNVLYNMQTFAWRSTLFCKMYNIAFTAMKSRYSNATYYYEVTSYQCFLGVVSSYHCFQV